MQTYTAIALLSLLGITLSASAAQAFESPSSSSKLPPPNICCQPKLNKRAIIIQKEAADAESSLSLIFTLINYKHFNDIGRKRFPLLS